MMKTQIHTEITPIVGSEQQSEELVMYLLKEFEENPVKIWDSNIFGKSLHSLVNEGMHNKLYRMPADAREKVRETIERIINDGCNGLLCTSCSLCRTWKSSKEIEELGLEEPDSPGPRQQRGEGASNVPLVQRGAVLAGVGGAAPAAVSGSPCL